MADIDGFTGIDRLKDHYKHCIRLSASNKINPKNAFDLQLIDYMQDLVSQTEDGQMNFKIASSALDVGAKIYSNRVDCIQSEAQKVASSILMALDGQHQSKRDDNADPNDTQADVDNSINSDRVNDSRENDEDGQAKVTKKKRTHRNKNIKTVVDDENLLDGKLEKMVLGDAFLDGLSQDYDMSCPAALICYNSLTQPDCLLTIESNNSRKNFREKNQPQVSHKLGTELNTIIEENETPEEDALDQTQILEKEETNEKQNDQEISENDGEDVVMTPVDGRQTPSEKTVASSTLALSNNQVSNTNSTTLIEQNSFVTLITKNVNCAQIIRNNQTNRICPRLENFLFNDRTTTLSGLNSNVDTTNVLDTSHPNLNSSVPTGRGHEFDLELYENGAANDDGDDHFDDAESNAGDEENQPVDADGNDILPDLDKIAASKPTDYGYSHEHSRLLNTWAGPHAWKAVKVPQSAKKNAAPQSTRKRAKLEQKPINFENGYSEGLEEIVDKTIRHSHTVIRSWRKIVIPEDHNLTGDKVRQETIVRIYNKPEETYHCFRTTADALKLVDKDHDYSKNDRNEERDVLASPGLGGFDDVHDDSDDEFRADPVEGNELAIYSAPLNTTIVQQADLEFAGENLIEQPYTVTHVNIPFAKIAKKMDVRKLKRVMWDLLLPPEKRLELQNNNTVVVNGVSNEDHGGEPTNNSENGTLIMMGGDEQHNETVIMNGVEEENRSQTVEKDKTDPSPAPSESAVHLEFSNLYGELPVRVSSKMASDLSQPIAFVTLLHLANEKVSLFNLLSLIDKFFTTKTIILILNILYQTTSH